MNYRGLLDEFIKILLMLRQPAADKQDAKNRAPKGEQELISYYDSPNHFKHPKNYWAKYGAFVRIRTDAFDHIEFFRKYKGFWAHRNVKDSLEEIFQAIADQGCAHEVTSFDGCYNNRVIRGGQRLSLHAFGAAVDLSAERLPLGSDKRFSDKFIKIWTDRGWTYGGDFKGRKDPHHFEYGGY